MASLLHKMSGASGMVQPTTVLGFGSVFVESGIPSASMFPELSYSTLPFVTYRARQLAYRDLKI
jgi:hypothetical protein